MRRPPSRCRCRWSTDWPPSAPDVASRAASRRRGPRSGRARRPPRTGARAAAPSSSVRSAADAMCATGMTRTWVGACGLMSRIAITRSSSWTLRRRDLARRRSGRTGSHRASGASERASRAGRVGAVRGASIAQDRRRSTRSAGSPSIAVRRTRDDRVLEVVGSPAPRRHRHERRDPPRGRPIGRRGSRVSNSTPSPSRGPRRANAARASAATASSSAARAFFVALVDLARPSASPACPGRAE